MTSPESEPIIEIDRLVKEYQPGRRAVDELSLQVFPGEIFGFLGPNGAGKTSTLKILTTLSKPTSGRALVAGHDVIAEPNAVRASIGYVGQQAGVDMALTGRENLVLQGHLFHLSKEEIVARVEELFSLFDLADSADWRVGGYSGGMKRKLDIAMALIHRPKVLFLDEPTLGLDPQSRNALWSHITRLNKEHRMTIFLTTHYLEEADRLSHRLAIVDRGKVRAIGTSDALKDTLAGDGIHLTFEEEIGTSELAAVRGGGGEGWAVRELIQEGKEIHLYLENGRGALPKLLQLLEQVKVPVRTVALSRPSLDDVFLKYTGHSMGKGEEASSGGNPWWPGGGGGDWQKWQKKWQKNGKEEEGSEKPPEESASPQGEWKGKEWPNEWSKSAAWSKEKGSEKKEEGESDWQKWGGKS
jgi:ABC-2 type transport system ATP-binding protein